MTGAWKRFAILAAAACLTGPASAYYHFVRYASRNAPFIPIPDKFDLSVLPNHTVNFYISDSGPTQFAANDSFQGAISQIRLAGRVWNEVGTSELRVVFGGLMSPDTPRTTPAIDVIFDELAPGVYGYGAPVARADNPVAGPGGLFVPITRSVLVLRRDVTERPSFSEEFFGTAVHEIGHTLGLQHTLTSSVMSTGFTRASTRATTLASDDIAAISLLYPSRSFAATTGTIVGQVRMSSGEGAALASVVALNPGGTAVSALANPDGSYRIEGLPPGQYYVYVHPLPPPQQPELGPADIVLPKDAGGRDIGASEPFETLFFPGTRNPEQALSIQVNAGSASEGINFTVRRRGALQLYGVTTYSYPGQVGINPAFVNMNGSQSRQFLVARSEGMGLTSGNGPVPGLSVSVLGGSAAVSQVRAYSQDPRYLRVDFSFNPATAPGPRHLIFSYNNDIYVLPAGLNIVNRQPPSIGGVNPDFDSSGARVAVITGTNIGPETRILFDGVTAAMRGAEDGRIVVAPPPAPGGHRANVVALNPDGQSSLFLQGRTPPTYAYDSADAQAALLSVNALPAGAESMIEITGVNTSFGDDTRLGFGSSDVTVRRLFVMGPTRLLANVAVASGAPPVAAMLTVANGLQIYWQPFAFQILPPNPRLPVVSSQLMNAATGQPSVFPGAVALAAVANAVTTTGAIGVTLNGTPLPVQPAGAGQIAFQVPSGFPTGPAILRLQSGTELSNPVVVAIDLPPPVIAGLTTVGNDGSRPLRAGEVVTLLVFNLADPGATVAPSRVRLSVGGVEHAAATVNPTSQAGNYLVQFQLSPAVSVGAQVPVVVTIDGRSSQPYVVAVQ